MKKRLGFKRPSTKPLQPGKRNGRKEPSKTILRFGLESMMETEPSILFGWLFFYVPLSRLFVYFQGCNYLHEKKSWQLNFPKIFFDFIDPRSWRRQVIFSASRRGGGNSNIFCLFTPIWGRWTHFDEHIFQMGWNHQPDLDHNFASFTFASQKATEKIQVRLVVTLRGLYPGAQGGKRFVGCFIVVSFWSGC